jgi:hypothetical protein
MALPAKPTTAQLLQTDSYQKIAEIDIDNPNLFFQQYSRKSLFVSFFLLFVLAGLGFMVAVTGVEISRGSSLWQIVLNILLLTGFILLVILPLHEAIHAITYKYFGADKIRFMFSLKPPSVFTCAHHLVISPLEIIWLALLPFILITLSLATAAYLLPAYKLFFGWAMSIHAICCLGDIILAGYIMKNRHKRIYNFDDLAEGKSYFFEQK